MTTFATLPEVHPTALAGTPVPAGRGRWHLVAYQRQWSSALPVALAELPDARSRRLDQQLNSAATLTFTISGRSPSAALLTELATDVVAYRWDEATARDVPMFRGLLDHSQDQLTEQAHTVNFVAHDYFAMLTRRMISTVQQPVGDQDSIVQFLINQATIDARSSSGTWFSPGSFLPLTTQRKNPDGSNRSNPGPDRMRNYQPGQVIGAAVDDLARVIDGFDYGMLHYGPSYPTDWLGIYYPSRGVTRTDVALVYGVNVSTVDRTVTSSDYANYVRVIGNKASSDPNAPQLYAERWNSDANNVTVNPVGLFALTENASDVTIQATLNEQAQGSLDYHGLIAPSYTIGLRPAAYTLGMVNMGDTVRLAITSGRLSVNTMVRVVGITYDVGDDGDENVGLTVGRAPATLASIVGAAGRDIDALARR